MSKQNDFFENYELNKTLDFYDSFEDNELGLKDEVLKGIYGYGYEKPSPIQRVAIKPIISGTDIVVQSHSGTGKTATFLIGTLQRIDETINKPQCIIISNTRELADQTYKVFLQLSKFTNIKGNLCIGGDMQNKYTNDNIKEHIIIGTPGRMSSMIGKDLINTDEMKIIVIDEADDVLSLSFRKQVKKIFQKLHSNVQVVLISATIPPEMSALFDEILKPDYLSILVKDDDLTLDGILQYYINIDEDYKNNSGIFTPGRLDEIRRMFVKIFDPIQHKKVWEKN
jgi:translation initiation factor 4A